MATTTDTRAAARRSRVNELNAMLEARRRLLMDDVHVKLRDARAGSALERDVVDQGESCEIDTQDEISFALIQMKAETLNNIETALRRLREGTYGDCFECGEEIAQARLRALPFAVRCRDCEHVRETAEARERLMARRRGSLALFLDLAN
jgi:DnaK suppressor protein